MTGDVVAIAIGRNEGERLRLCLSALSRQTDQLIYVDSGSTDGSVAVAEAIGAHVVALDMSIPFTAARARNAGFDAARTLFPTAEFLQFIDGDCELIAGWLETGKAALQANPDLAVVCGRVRERHPEATLYNRILDEEWDTPIGEISHCGGIALMRRDAFEAQGGFRKDLIAGEEPELCFRLRQAGWKIHRLDAEMTLHDAAMTRFSQWWKRVRRAGHTYAEGVALHGRTPERYRVRELGRTLVWGLVFPLVIVLGLVFVSPWMGLLVCVWPIQAWRQHRRGKSWAASVLTVIGKHAEVLGVLGYWRAQLMRKRVGLIEYK